ncbi:MAG TPA: N(G),N(G)-dimethylarginine dimethylaminohydrolase [Allosphingosinicella sp.]|nr:N(G),N(G)-dimethylarginine dimethylaminohydrolase [Allosphingosinicella sp.]
MATGTAYTRALSPRLAECELTHLEAAPIDMARAEAQHEAYENALAEAGFTLVRLPALPDHPDGVFVEDAALILGRHAIITRPGAASRAGETASAAEALASDFTIHRLDRGTLDGGDVLWIEDTLYVGRSGRTSDEGIAALAEVAGPLGYAVVPVEAKGCLHLKTAATFAGRDPAGIPVLVHHPAWISSMPFRDVEPLAIDPGEPNGANVLRAGGRLFVSSEAPRTADKLAARGFDVALLDVSELHKAESGLTCCSLLAEY